MDILVVSNFIVNLVKTDHAIVFSCSFMDFKDTSLALMERNQFVSVVHLNESYSLESILTRESHARTSILVNANCSGTAHLLFQASESRYFNKTYQWFLWGVDLDVITLFPLELKYVGPNAQITFINKTENGYAYWDVHSKGRHLKSQLEINLIATLTNDTLNIVCDIFHLQSIEFRGQFRGLNLRGASVIDKEDIISNEQIESILSRPTKDSGVAAFIKYHYELLGLLRERFNFTVNFRNSRGWAGRLGNTTFRLGLLGIIMRNEADIAASGAFNRINRFAEFDIIHQSWKFETAFLYRYTPDLDTHGKSGNFLSPFSDRVWLFSLLTLGLFSIIWMLFEIIDFKFLQQRNFGQKRNNSTQKINTEINNLCIKTTCIERILQTFGACCQQGLDPNPKDRSVRFLVMTLFLFSLVMYNYYTSSVVGGLLSSSDQGPSSVDEITSSPLKISFEDIGYYKVLFRESENQSIKRLIEKKLSSARKSNELGIFSHIEEAVPYLKAGGFAFHCEVVDAYPVIAEFFDANEICDLREVSGLMEVEIMNWILHKNSQYTEIFRTAMCNAHEKGFVERILRRRQIKKPACQSLYTVYPVSLSGVLPAFVTLICGFLISLLLLCMEKLYVYLGLPNRVVFGKCVNFSIKIKVQILFHSLRF
ncbi:ionotropic receptor 75a isoform X2 [Drosophila ficusphila]|uniref:ionotropic receptor 75a isoform X2 n=1 Tax=Drosophila ficusphila TaxID=30025 RepID=UPI001C89E895|nr:ionotropic receptor 75a isoform X2 [Drosophila ficusphila]